LQMNSINYMSHFTLYGKIAGGFAAVIGHNWPLYFGFKGGKGVLTGFAVLIMLNWWLALISLGIFAVVFLISGYVSLGSIIAAISYMVMEIFRSLFFSGGEADYLYMGLIILLCVLIVFTHRSNIGRLLKGEETNSRKIFRRS